MQVAVLDVAVRIRLDSRCNCAHSTVGNLQGRNARMILSVYGGNVDYGPMDLGSVIVS